MLGKTLDTKYTLISLIGQGGMGAVYEAKHTTTGRRVAVKVITDELLIRKGADAVGRFHREAKAAGAIDTLHIAQVLDAGTDPSTSIPYLVMEYLKGEDLRHLLKRLGPLPPAVALQIAAQACIGLSRAHEARVIHRDIKPANLFLVQREEGEILVKILDFGIAKIKTDDRNGEETTGLTGSGGMIGSPLYMSPEQARGNKAIDYRTDLWSLGVVLYRALTGHTPHEEVDGLGELIIAICSEPAPPVQRLAPWVAPEIAAVAHRALQIDVKARYQSAAEMLEAIKPLLADGLTLREPALIALTDEERSFVAPRLERSDHVSATPPGMSRSDASPEQSGEESRSHTNDGMTPSTRPRQARTRSRTPVVLGAAAVLCAGAFGVYRALPPSLPPRAAPPEVAKVAATEAESPAPAPVPSPSPAPPVASSAPAAEAALRLRQQRLLIAPTSAAVEIDGVRAPVQEGTVTLRGPVGSVHRVRVWKGKRETLSDVTITEDSALPPKLELDEVRSVKPGSARPARAGEPAAAPAEPQAAPPKATAPTAAPPKPHATPDPLTPESFQ